MIYESVAYLVCCKEVPLFVIDNEARGGKVISGCAVCQLLLYAIEIGARLAEWDRGEG